MLPNPEILWMLLSILSLSTENQILLIGYKENSYNNMDNDFRRFASALEVYKYSFVDEFDFLYDFQKDQFSSIQQSFSEALSKISDLDMNKISFSDGMNWRYVREIGKKILNKTELPLFEPLEVIDFNELLEFIYDDNDVLIGYN